MLRKEIRKFGKLKLVVALPLIVLGFIGLVFPIIPGLAFLALGVVLIIPSLEKKLSRFFAK